MKSIKESDWKIYKELREIALERYCKRSLEKVRKIIDENIGDSEERFLTMTREAHHLHKHFGHLFDDFRRLTAIRQLSIYYADELLTHDEISRLSEDGRDQVVSLSKIMLDD